MGSIVAEIADKIASAGGGERSELEVRGGTGADGGGTLTLSTSELTVVDGDKLGRIDFQAPLETGADALLVGASIYAEADDTFAADNNSTELVFATGASEAAAEKMRITSDGKVGIGTATPVTDLTVEGPITIKEQAAADADTAGYGQIWVDDAANSPLMYTNDAGADIGITTGSTLNAASLGGVLPSGVTGGSGLTALGTVATGNLSNANIVYPAGHVVKVTQHLDSTNYTTTGMTLKKGPTSGTITMNDTSNKMYISVMFLTQFTTNGMRVALYRNPTVSSGDLINGGVNLTPGTEPQAYITSGGSSYIPITHNYLDTPGANSTYGLVYYEHPGNSGSSDIKGVFFQTSFTFMEIQV